MAKPKWQETSRGSTWEMQTANLRIVVTRRLHLEGWWLFVRTIGIEQIELCSADLDEAKREALVITGKRLDQLRREFDKIASVS